MLPCSSALRSVPLLRCPPRSAVNARLFPSPQAPLLVPPLCRLAGGSSRDAKRSKGATRSSNQFAFSTKYPRQKPSWETRGSRSGGGGGGGKKTGKGVGKLPGLALPARLRLATFKGPKKAVEKPQAAKHGVSRTHGDAARRPAAGAKPAGRLTAADRAASAAAGLAAREAYDLKTAKHVAKFSLSSTKYDEAKPDTLASVRERIENARFDELGLHGEVVKTVTETLGYGKPTAVQALCIPEILQNPAAALLCAAETGGGKTAAYLLPIISRLKGEEEMLAAAVSQEDREKLAVVEAIIADGSTTSALSGTATVRKLRRPRAVIVVPSRELVAQVTASAKAICHKVRLRVVGAHAGMATADVEARFANAPVDILVATPGSLNWLMRSCGFALSQTRHLVIDEADTMTDEDFAPELDAILQAARKFATALDRPCQYVFVSATVPLTLGRMLDRHFPAIKRVTTPSVHRTVPGLRQRFVRIDGSTTKPAMLLDVLKRAVIDDDRIIVFCNTRKSCETAAAALREKGYDAHDISSNVEVRDRTKALKNFATEPSASTSETSDQGDVQSDGKRKPMILVATDIASRGLDTVNVGHVILYDFPQTAIDYLHRVGRTARNGAKGKATTIVSKKERKLADKIENDVRRKHVLT
ncbi:hypothetical protein HDU90_002764 [Geranomyces variabilis]|nr:hypothetical protein HDU90_002764 [Geranomyces variabilis]